MNVASKELCQELYELSGWRETAFYWAFDTDHFHYTNKKRYHLTVQNDIESKICPAYDLGYLLRKLPNKTTISKNPDRDEYAAWLVDAEKDTFQEADTPEDAATKLAIELFKQGILKADN